MQTRRQYKPIGLWTSWSRTRGGRDLTFGGWWYGYRSVLASVTGSS